MFQKKTWAQRVDEERPERADPMQSEEWNALVNWIYGTYKDAKTPWRGHTSYGEKHEFERDTGIYVTNSQFKKAMKECGFQAVTEDEINWEYRIRLREKRDYNRKSKGAIS